MEQTIYLDNAATTKPKKEVIESMMPYFCNKWHNPSSLYKEGYNVKEDIERARRVVGNFIGANSNEIYFTSGGSESNCWVIQGFINHCKHKNKTAVIITSLIEHKSIMECVKNMDVNTYYIGVDEKGFVDVESLEKILGSINTETREVLVSLQFANNEIGTIQPIKKIAEIVHKYNAVFHTDAVQAMGQIPINVKEFGIDMLSASGHKIGTPKGVGILYKKSNVEIDPLIYGSQMDSMRGGTENVPYIIGMAKAVELYGSNDLKELYNKRNYFIARLIEEFKCILNGSLSNRLPNNISVTFPQNITGEALLYTLDMCGIEIGVGSACNSHNIEPSYVLKTIGLDDEKAMKTIRITLPNDITYKDINNTIEEIKKSIKLIEI